MGTTYLQLPIPMDQPVTGQSLLEVINYLLDPILAVAGNIAAGEVSSIAPLTLTLPNGDQIPAWASPAYTPAVGDRAICVASPALAILLGIAP